MQEETDGSVFRRFVRKKGGNRQAFVTDYLGIPKGGETSPEFWRVYRVIQKLDDPSIRRFTHAQESDLLDLGIRFEDVRAETLGSAAVSGPRRISSVGGNSETNDLLRELNRKIDALVDLIKVDRNGAGAKPRQSPGELS